MILEKCCVVLWSDGLFSTYERKQTEVGTDKPGCNIILLFPGKSRVVKDIHHMQLSVRCCCIWKENGQSRRQRRQANHIAGPLAISQTVGKNYQCAMDR